MLVLYPAVSKMSIDIHHPDPTARVGDAMIVWDARMQWACEATRPQSAGIHHHGALLSKIHTDHAGVEQPRSGVATPIFTFAPDGRVYAYATDCCTDFQTLFWIEMSRETTQRPQCISVGNAPGTSVYSTVKNMKGSTVTERHRHWPASVRIPVETSRLDCFYLRSSVFLLVPPVGGATASSPIRAREKGC